MSACIQLIRSLCRLPGGPAHSSGLPAWLQGPLQQHSTHTMRCLQGMLSTRQDLVASARPAAGAAAEQEHLHALLAEEGGAPAQQHQLHALLAEDEAEVEAGGVPSELAGLQAAQPAPTVPATGEAPAHAVTPDAAAQSVSPSVRPPLERGRPGWLPAASSEQFADLNPVGPSTRSS